MTQITVSKIDAATRELDVAIRMRVAGGDPVAIAVLVGSAAVVAEDLAEKNGKTSFAQHVAPTFPFGGYKTYQKMTREPYNFMKHADHADETDPNATIAFDDRDTEGLMLAVITDLQYFRDSTPTEIAYMAWKFARDNVRLPEHVAGLGPFLQEMLPGIANASLVEQLRAGQGLVEAFNAAIPPPAFHAIKALFLRRA